MACLVYYGKQIDIDKELSIGRGEANELCIKEKTISKKHAILKELDELFYIIDNDSTNGTFLNHRRINIPTPLTSGDLIQVGNVELIFNDNTDEDDDKTLLANEDFIVDSIVLVSDIKGYTDFSELVPISTVKRFMSNWFKDVSKTIRKNGGFVDKFIGDCVYVRWDKAMDKQHLQLALKSAYELNEIVKKLNEKFLSDIDYKVSVGVSIHAGEVILGGADFVPSGISDTVNTAFRLESQTRSLNTDIIISSEAYELLDEDINSEIDNVSVKGKREDLIIYKTTFDDIEKFAIEE